MKTSVAGAAWRSRRLTALWVGLLVAIILLLGIATYRPVVDPYLASVLSLSGDRSRGAAIFQMNCAICHGQTARGEIGPSLVAITDHRSKASLVDQVISGKTPPMPQFQPDPQAMADLLKYLDSL
ncbi:MAG: c-type cytochrome [Nodosilinea sp.]|jgi:mono/diheme cytochrome c family protein